MPHLSSSTRHSTSSEIWRRQASHRDHPRVSGHSGGTSRMRSGSSVALRGERRTVSRTRRSTRAGSITQPSGSPRGSTGRPRNSAGPSSGSLEDQPASRIRPGIARSLNGLADLARLEGDYATASSLYKKSLAAWWDLSNTPESLQTLENLATVMIASGQSEPSVRILGAAQAVREAMSVPRSTRHS